MTIKNLSIFCFGLSLFADSECISYTPYISELLPLYHLEKQLKSLIQNAIEIKNLRKHQSINKLEHLQKVKNEMKFNNTSLKIQNVDTKRVGQMAL